MVLKLASSRMVSIITTRHPQFSLKSVPFDRSDMSFPR
jgi:hypothetical protein